MRKGMALFREQRIRFPLPLCAVLLAEIEDELERIEHALAILDDALADAELTGQHHFDAELHRQRGALLLRNTPDDVAATEAAFLRAIEVARSQQAPRDRQTRTLASQRPRVGGYWRYPFRY